MNAELVCWQKIINIKIQLQLQLWEYSLAELSIPVTSADLYVPKLYNSGKTGFDMCQLIIGLGIQTVGVRQ